MEVIKEPSCVVKCPQCNCEFKFGKEDIYNATGGCRKGNPINPHKAVHCPFCDTKIAIWGTDKKVRS